MKILVTGGAGFVGSHLVDRLLGDGNEVVVVDDLSSGSAANLAGHRNAAGWSFVEGDVRDRRLVTRAVASADLVFHLAGAVGVRVVADDPVGTWSRNVLGTETVLSACAERGVRCLFSSTSEVYGPTVSALLSEDDPVLLSSSARRDVYAISKLAGESLALALHRAEGLPVTVARLFNVVGPRQASRYGMVLPRFARAAAAGEALTVHGDGTQTRCFLHVADAVEALLALARSPSAAGAVVNVGSDEEVSIADLAREVLSAAGSSSPVRFVPFEEVYGPGFVDPPRRRPDLSRARALVGWRPRHSLSDAVGDVLRSLRAKERVAATR